MADNQWVNEIKKLVNFDLTKIPDIIWLSILNCFPDKLIYQEIQSPIFRTSEQGLTVDFLIPNSLYYQKNYPIKEVIPVEEFPIFSNYIIGLNNILKINALISQVDNHATAKNNKPDFYNYTMVEKCANILGVELPDKLNFSNKDASDFWYKQVLVQADTTLKQLHLARIKLRQYFEIPNESIDIFEEYIKIVEDFRELLPVLINQIIEDSGYKKQVTLSGTSIANYSINLPDGSRKKYNWRGKHGDYSDANYFIDQGMISEDGIAFLRVSLDQYDKYYSAAKLFTSKWTLSMGNRDTLEEIAQFFKVKLEIFTTEIEESQKYNSFIQGVILELDNYIKNKLDKSIKLLEHFNIEEAPADIIPKIARKLGKQSGEDLPSKDPVKYILFEPETLNQLKADFETELMRFTIKLRNMPDIIDSNRIS